MSNRLRFGDGSGVTVEMSDELEELARRAANDVHPELIDELGGHAERIHRQTKARWPVGREREGRPFHSKDRWTWNLVVNSTNDSIQAVVGNDADWVRFVTPRWLHGGSGVREMVTTPMRKAHRQIVHDLGDLIGRSLGGD